MNSVQKSDDVCVVCCRSSTIYAVGPCDHRVCYICSSRMRVLCLKNECPICRQDMPKVIFTKTEHTFSMLSKVNFRMDHKFKICFADDDIEEEYYLLLEENCLLCPTNQGFNSFGHLKDHLRKSHEMYFCDLCVEHLKLFTYERRCYNRKDLARHKRLGDPEDTSHKGHPLCRYCEQRYVDNDELYRHLRKDHYYCHFCDADGSNTMFFANYSLLYAHFQEDHFVCEEGSCREDRYTGVFRSDIDLKVHKAAQHSKNLTKQQAKQARTLELNFSITPRYVQQNGNYMTGESDRDGYNRRGGRRGGGQKGPRRDTRQEFQGTEMAMTVPERLSPIPDTEASINVQCEQEFPHLGINQNGALENQSLSNSHAKNNKKMSAPYKKWSGALTEDDFPSLSNSAPPNSSGARNTFLVQFNNKTQPHVPNLSIQVSTKPKMMNPDTNFSGKGTRVTTQQNLVLQQPSRGIDVPDGKISKGPPSSIYNKNTSAVTFEQNFPKLGGEGSKETVRTTVTVPLWRKQEEQKREPPNSDEFMQYKGKNKKNIDKGTIVTAQMKPKENIDNGNKKKKKDSQEDDWIMIGKNSVQNQEKKTPVREDKLVSNLQKISKSFAEETKDVEKQTKNLVMDDFPTLESMHQKPKQPKSAEETEDNLSGWTKMLPTKNLLVDDFPSLESMHQKPSVVPPGFQKPKSAEETKDGEKQMKNLVMDDFPALESVHEKPVVPPGFQKPKQPKSAHAPPGFISKKPSINISLSSVAQDLTNPSNNNGQSSPSSIPISNSSTFPTNATYLEPQDFQARNQLLIQEIRQVLLNEAEVFEQFKMLSGQFRQSLISPKEYYEKCIGLFGKENFNKILSELLVLLPDIGKQQELLAVYNKCKRKDAEGGGAVPKNGSWNVPNVQFMVCASCQQVLCNRDFRGHMASHEDDFPTLIPSNRTTTRITWVKK